MRTFLGDGLYTGKQETKVENQGTKALKKESASEWKGVDESEQTSLLGYLSSSLVAKVSREAPFHECVNWVETQGKLIEALKQEREDIERRSITIQNCQEIGGGNEPWVLRNGARRIVNFVDVTRNYICVKFDRYVNFVFIMHWL